METCCHPRIACEKSSTHGVVTRALQPEVPAVPSALTYFRSAHPDFHTDFLGGIVILETLGDGTKVFSDCFVTYTPGYVYLLAYRGHSPPDGFLQ